MKCGGFVPHFIYYITTWGEASGNLLKAEESDKGKLPDLTWQCIPVI